MDRRCLFVYGTLLDPAVRRLVTGAVDPCAPVPAVLGHWQRIGLAGRAYPVIIPAAGGRVQGLLLRGLSRKALARLDDYETSEYRRIRVLVKTPRGRKRCEAYVAVGHPRMAHRAWSLYDWQVSQRHLLSEHLHGIYR